MEDKQIFDLIHNKGREKATWMLSGTLLLIIDLLLILTSALNDYRGKPISEVWMGRLYISIIACTVAIIACFIMERLQRHTCAHFRKKGTEKMRQVIHRRFNIHVPEDVDVFTLETQGVIVNIDHHPSLMRVAWDRHPVLIIEVIAQRLPMEVEILCIQRGIAKDEEEGFEKTTAMLDRNELVHA